MEIATAVAVQTFDYFAYFNHKQNLISQCDRIVDKTYFRLVI